MTLPRPSQRSPSGTAAVAQTPADSASPYVAAAGSGCTRATGTEINAALPVPRVSQVELEDGGLDSTALAVAEIAAVVAAAPAGAMPAPTHLLELSAKKMEQEYVCTR